MVLTRRVNEKIIIGPLPEGLPPGTVIEVEVVKVQGARVRIGFTAPLEVPIDRLEAREKFERSKEGSSE